MSSVICTLRQIESELSSRDGELGATCSSNGKEESVLVIGKKNGRKVTTRMTKI